MTGDVADLFDYRRLRESVMATMTVVDVAEPIVVLGSAQSLETLRHDSSVGPVRRRRGGGGVVLAQPDDLWVDWWIPARDPRWSDDVRASAVAAGRWWRDALKGLVTGDVEVHEGPMSGAAQHRVVCFAGRGPGEVFVDGRKAVGLTQWRVREGVLLSSVLPARSSDALLGMLMNVPEGLGDALDHHTRSSLGLDDATSVVDLLARASGSPAVSRQHLLS